MTEEITYANLKFQGSVTALSTLKHENKDPEVSTLQSKKKATTCPRIAIALLVILVLLSLTALLIMVVLFLQVYQEKLDFQDKNKNISQTLTMMKDYFCLNNEDPGEGSSCSVCQKGWIQNRRKCYYLSGNKLSWELSRQFCLNQSSSLWIIKSEEQKELASNIFPENCGYMYNLWIGLQYTSGELWEWIDGRQDNVLKLDKPFRTYRCGSLEYCKSAKARQCDEEYTFLCEKEAFDLSLLTQDEPSRELTVKSLR